jgi:hypothetical protein
MCAPLDDTQCACCAKTKQLFDALYGRPVASPNVDFARHLFAVGLQLAEVPRCQLTRLHDDIEERIRTWPIIVSPYDDAIVDRAISHFRTAHTTAAAQAAKTHKRSLKYAKHRRQRDRQRELDQLVASIGIVR